MWLPVSVSMIVLVQSELCENPLVRGIVWHDARGLFQKILMDDGQFRTRVLLQTNFGQVLARTGIYSPSFAVEVPTLVAALGLLGLGLERAGALPVASVHFCPNCRLGRCESE